MPLWFAGPPTRLLQNYPLVAHTARDPLAIQIFQQRNRILAGYAKQVFEVADVELGGFRLLGSDLAAQSRVERIADETPDIVRTSLISMRDLASAR